MLGVVAVEYKVIRYTATIELLILNSPVEMMMGVLPTATISTFLVASGKTTGLGSRTASGVHIIEGRVVSVILLRSYDVDFLSLYYFFDVVWEYGASQRK